MFIKNIFKHRNKDTEKPFDTEWALPDLYSPLHRTALIPFAALATSRHLVRKLFF